MTRCVLTLIAAGLWLGPWCADQAEAQGRRHPQPRPAVPGSISGAAGSRPSVRPPATPQFQRPNLPTRPPAVSNLPGMGAIAKPAPKPLPQLQPRPVLRPSPGGESGGWTRPPNLARPLPAPQPKPQPVPERPSIGIKPPTPKPAPLPNPGRPGQGIHRPTPLPAPAPKPRPELPSQPQLPGQPNPPTVRPPSRPVPPIALPGRPQVRPSIPQRPGIGGNTNTIINRPSASIHSIYNNKNITSINRFTQVTNNISPGAWTSNYVNHWHNYTPSFYRWYYRPYPWYHGCWHWHWSSDRGVVPWYVYSSLAFRYGYWTFVNPFWVTPAVQPVAYLNYSQPVTVVAPQWVTDEELSESAAPLERAVNEQAMAQLEAARTAFRHRNYREAQRLVEAALAAAPEEAVLHEFRALVLFALGQYGEAAAALYSLLAVHPGWNWTTLSSMYGDIGDYQRQIQALNAARQAQPDAANLQFLYAYHMLTLGKPDDAKAALLLARKGLPEDPLVNQMLLALGESPSPAQESPPPPKAADVELDLKGLWKAERSGGRAVYLRFDDQGQFQWDSLGGPEKDTFTGAFAVDGANLTLERTDGGALVGQVIPQSEKSFLFRLIGTPPQDPGMRFERVDSKP